MLPLCRRFLFFFPAPVGLQIHQSAPAQGARKPPHHHLLHPQLRQMDKCCHSRLVLTPQRRRRNRRMPHHSKKKPKKCKRSGRLFFSSPLPSPPSTSSSSSRVPQQFEFTSRRERRLIGSQPFELLICFWMTNGESWERDKQGQCDCSHETKGSLSPRTPLYFRG